MTDFGATLKRSASTVKKKDLELELEELEEAATMVVEEQEDQKGDSRSAQTPSSDSSSSDSSDSSSSDSSDESEESDAEGQGCTDSKKGGGGEGGETFKDNPLLHHPTTTTATTAAAASASVSPIPQEPTVTFLSAGRKVEALPSDSESSRQLIQELGERVAEEMKISQDQNSSRKAERNCSQLSSGAAKTEGTSEMSSSSGTLLEPNPRRNPLLIVQTQEDPDDNIFICGSGI